MVDGLFSRPINASIIIIIEDRTDDGRQTDVGRVRMPSTFSYVTRAVEIHTAIDDAATVVSTHYRTVITTMMGHASLFWIAFRLLTMTGCPLPSLLHGL
jgi:hypothetical protein